MAFVSWIKGLGAKLRKTRLAIYAPEFRGLHATVDIAPGEDILSIPMINAMSSLSIRETQFGAVLEATRPIDREWEPFILPIVYILEERLNPSSRIKPYLDVMPRLPADHPAFYSESEREWLKGSSTTGNEHPIMG